MSRIFTIFTLFASMACIGWAGSVLAYGQASPPDADGAVVHQLNVTIVPDQQALKVKNAIALPSGVRSAAFHLSQRVAVRKVTRSGKALAFTHTDGRLRIAIPEGEGTPLHIVYAGRFDDQAPVQPLNTDNPGFGVSATIGERGAMLLSGSGWYPDTIGIADHYTLRVTAPAGMVAVTAGKPGPVTTAQGVTRSIWHAGSDRLGLPLVAGPYHVARRTLRGHTVATYFSEDLKSLSEGYLTSASEFLERFSGLFGPYAFAEFAIVENFFPTGYGFPSFTLLGRRVLQLPFIRHTSLGHEIAHCWWGNGVMVDYAQGNWSEALTTYVADYHSRERAGRGEAYRRQWLRNYASIVSPQADFPISQFLSRTDPISRVIGYDKGAMVFHMLRQKIGDAQFWDTLRSIYENHRFQALAWSDLQSAFEKKTGRDLDLFFRQWIFQPGAPELALADIQVKSNGAAGHTVTGVVVQQQPFYAFDMAMELKTAHGSVTQSVAVVPQARSPFTMVVDHLPKSLQADPGTHLFRRLDASEIPASINGLRGASDVHVVVSPDMGPQGMELARRLSVGLGLKRPMIGYGPENAPGPSSPGHRIFVGHAGARASMDKYEKPVRIIEQGVRVNGKSYSGRQISFFGVFNDPAIEGRLVAVYLPGAPDTALAVSAKIQHYGKYSYLVFDGSRNQAKGQWPSGPSPLVHVWPSTQEE